MRVYSLAVSGGTLFAGTENFGVWQRPISEAGVLSGSPKSPQMHGNLSFRLEVPNSAHPKLSIGFSLSKPEKVSIALFTLSGKETQTFLNNRLPSGSYRFNFDTRNIARGCFAVRMQAENIVNAKIIRIDY